MNPLTKSYGALSLLLTSSLPGVRRPPVYGGFLLLFSTGHGAPFMSFRLTLHPINRFNRRWHTMTHDSLG